MRIALVVLDDVFDTGLAAVLDAFETADQLSELARFQVSPVAVRARVRTHQGLIVPTGEPPARAPDVAIVPALACKQPDQLLAALDRPDVRDAIELVRRWHARGTKLAAACTGTF